MKQDIVSNGITVSGNGKKPKKLSVEKCIYQPVSTPPPLEHKYVIVTENNIKEVAKWMNKDYEVRKKDDGSFRVRTGNVYQDLTVGCYVVDKAQIFRTVEAFEKIYLRI